RAAGHTEAGIHAGLEATGAVRMVSNHRTALSAAVRGASSIMLATVWMDSSRLQAASARRMAEVMAHGLRHSLAGEAPSPVRRISVQRNTASGPSIASTTCNRVILSGERASLNPPLGPAEETRMPARARACNVLLR